MSDPDPAQILAVDDVPANLDVLRVPLEQAGFRFLASPDGEVALKVARHSRPDVILMDVLMPGENGFEVCRRLKADPDLADIPVIFLTARDDTDSVVEGFAAGGVDYIVKPFHQEEVLSRVRTHLQISRLSRDLQSRTQQLEAEIAEREALQDRVAIQARRESERWGVDGLVGNSSTMQSILSSVALAQGSDSIRVLITGESGTGKELIARAIHSGSGRLEQPFVTVNCASIPAELADSMFFGHRRGSFTGAERDHRGYFEQAQSGTLFLDEIGDMPLPIQAKILRVLEDGQVQPVGATDSITVDVRVVSATNADLTAAIDSGTFRQDLYYRLAQYSVQVPALRERPDDILLLAQHFLTQLAAEMGATSPGLSAGALTVLQNHSWPGNVRELRNAIERALLESHGLEVEAHHVHLIGAGRSSVPGSSPAPGIPDDLDEATQYLVERALAAEEGNVSSAAQRLGIHRSRIYRILSRRDES